MSAAPHRRTRALLVAAALVASAACGSTVPTEQRAGGGTLQQGGTAGGDGLTVPGGPADGATAGGTAGTTGGSTGTAFGGTAGTGGSTTGGTSAGTTTGGTGSTTGGTTGAGTTGGGSAAVSGKGITATAINLGIPYCNDCASGNAALGAGGQDPGDTRRYYQTALDDVNARGGVLGRKLAPVWHSVSVADNIDTSAQAACERWTSDTQVAAMFLRGEVIYQCAKNAGVMVMGSGGIGPTYEKYPNLFSPASVPLEGLYGDTVRAMVKAGWHKPVAPWPTGKIGLITWDTPEYEYAMKNGYQRALAAAGLKETDTRYIAVPQNAGSVADASAAVSNAVLSFRSQNIDHVMIGDGPAGIFTGVGLTLLFLQNAQSQNYFPRYGFNGNNAPDFPQHPKEQLAGMLAIDFYDEDPSKDKGIALNPQRERCLALMRKKGLPVGDGQTMTLAINACEIAWFAEAVFKRSGGSSLDRVIPGAESIGTAYRSGLTYGTKLGPGRHAGVHMYRNLQYSTDCSCIEYTSKPYEP